MRIVVFGIMALIIGASAGVMATRFGFGAVEERFEVLGTVSKADVGESRPTEMTLVGGDTIDFGLVTYESEQSHVFVVRNDGEAPLRVSKETVSCGLCVLTDFNSAVVHPGETLDIPVTLRARKKGPKLAERLELRTNDPVHRSVALHLNAYVGSAALLTAEGMPLGSVDSLKGAEASCHIHGYFSDQIEFVEGEFARASRREYFEYEVKQLDLADVPNKNPYVRTGYEVTVRVKPGIPMGPFQQTLRLLARVEGQEDTRLELPIQGNVAGAISLLGPQYAADYGYLGGGRVLSSEGKTWEMHVMVKGEGHADVKLNVASVDPSECLTAVLGEPKALGENITMHPLTLTVPKGAPSMVRLGNDQGEAGQVIIKTTHPTSKEVVLLVRFAVE
jgi:hypothetical protein